jgi:hypothetical protein
MFTFQFTVDSEVFTFKEDAKNTSIRDCLRREFPNCDLVLDYNCMCINACDCVEGHFVSTSKWVSDDISKPWEGSNVEYYVPLQIVHNGVARDYTDHASGNRY